MHRFPPPRAPLLFLLLSVVARAPAAEMRVAPHGNDDGTGSNERPFGPPERARDAIRRLPRAADGRLPAGATVLLRGGTYSRRTPFLVTGLYSGTAEPPIVYRPHPGEWYLDRQAGLLNLYPTSPDSLTPAFLTLATGPLVRLSGASHGILQGLTLGLTRGDGVHVERGPGVAVERGAAGNGSDNHHLADNAAPRERTGLGAWLAELPAQIPGFAPIPFEQIGPRGPVGPL